MTYLRAKLYIARNRYLCLRLFFTRDYLIYLKVLHNMHILKFIGKSPIKVSFNEDEEVSYMGIKCIEYFIHKNLLVASYKMLCWLIEQGYIDPKDK